MDKFKKYINEYKYEENCPKLIRNRKQFVCWKYELIDGKWAKVPYNPNAEYNEKELWKCRAKSNDESTWGKFKEACDSVKKYNYDGVGIMLGRSLIGIDLDDVIENGEISNFAKSIIDMMGSYTEYSPSKTGIHILLFGDMDKSRRKKINQIEIYKENRFFTFTGDIVDSNNKIIDKVIGTEKVNELYDNVISKLVETNEYSIKETIKLKEKKKVKIVDSYSFSNEEIIEKLISQGERRKYKSSNKNFGINLEKELLDGNWQPFYKNQSLADFALVVKIAYYTSDINQINEIFMQSGLMRDKWIRRLNEETYGEYTIRKVLNIKKRKKYYKNMFFKKNRCVKEFKL